MVANASQSGWSLRHVNGVPANIDIIEDLAISTRVVVFRYLPLRIVRPGGVDADVMAATGKPLSHFAGVFPNPYKFRRVINAVN
jgi:hypothetical protein